MSGDMSGRVTTFNPSVMSRWGCPIKAAAEIVLFPVGNPSKTSRFDQETARDDITDPGNTISRRPIDQPAPGRNRNRGRGSVFAAAFDQPAGARHIPGPHFSPERGCVALDQPRSVKLAVSRACGEEYGRVRRKSHTNRGGPS